MANVDHKSLVLLSESGPCPPAVRYHYRVRRLSQGLPSHEQSRTDPGLPTTKRSKVNKMNLISTDIIKAFDIKYTYHESISLIAFQNKCVLTCMHLNLYGAHIYCLLL